MASKISARRIYLIYAGATSLFYSLVFTVSGVYYIQSVNLDPLQLVLVGTALEAAVFLFEVPTGVVADRYSRKTSVLIGLALVGAGFLLEGSIPTFAAVLMAQVLWGFGWTFTSGADQAWIADEIGDQHLEDLFLQETQVRQGVGFIGIMLSVALGNALLNLPILIGGAAFLTLALFLLYAMPETNFRPSVMPTLNKWRSMWDMFMTGLKFISKSRTLKLVLGISLFYGLYSEGLDRLSEIHFISEIGLPAIWDLNPIVWIGAINAAAMILNIIAVGIVKKKLKENPKQDKTGVLLMVNLLLICSIIAFGLSGNFEIALLTYWATKITRRVNGPIYRAWINRHIGSQVRATVLSTIGQFDALGQILGGPALGYLARESTISMAIVTAGAILIPVLFLFLAVSKRRIIKIGRKS